MANPSEEEDKGSHETKGSECSGSRSCHRAILLVLSVVGEKRKRSLPKEVPQERGKKSEEKRFLIPTSMTFFSGNVHFGSASFAVTTVRRWWFLMGFALYPDAKELTITADGGRK